MKLWELVTLTNKKPKAVKTTTLQLSHNEIPVMNLQVQTNSNRNATYRELRSLVKPRYELMYLIRQAKGFNTVFFRQNFDIIWCDRNFNVLELYTDVAPNFASNHNALGHFVYFSPVGTINNLNLKIGDELRAAREIFAMPII